MRIWLSLLGAALYSLAAVAPASAQTPTYLGPDYRPPQGNWEDAKWAYWNTIFTAADREPCSTFDSRKVMIWRPNTTGSLNMQNNTLRDMLSKKVDPSAGESPIELWWQESSSTQNSVRFDYGSGASELDLENNGHSVELLFDPDRYDADKKPSQRKLTYNNKTYTLKNLHFHYPSEHRLFGVTFPMEMHFVHEDVSNNKAVFAVFLKFGTKNAILAPLFDKMEAKKLNKKDDKAPVTFGTSDLTRLLPQNPLFVTYQGSLTTPDCGKGVVWLLSQIPMEISEGQLEQFKAAIKYGRDGVAVNARPLQPYLSHSLSAPPPAR